MKRSLLMITAVVVLVGALAIPSFAFGGMGGRGFGPGMAGVTAPEDLEAWIQDQVEDGWMTQKQADYLIAKEKLRMIDKTEEEYFADIDSLVQAGWITEKQAELFKDRYAQYQELQNDPANTERFQAGFNCPMYTGQPNAPYMKNRMGGFGQRGGMNFRGPQW